VEFSEKRRKKGNKKERKNEKKGLHI